MSGAEDAAPALVKEDPEKLVLRGRPRPVVRFRRKVIVGVTAAVAAILVGLSWIALEPPAFQKSAGSVGNPEPSREAGPEAIANAPKSYADVPRLGPPLPGDLGGPILDHRRSLEAVSPAAVRSLDGEREASLATVDRERAQSALEAARSAPVIVQLAQPPRLSEPGVATPASAPVDSAREEPTGSSNAQHKIEFARSSTGNVEPHELRPPASQWLLTAGTVIPASFITGLNSDLPGMVLAQVTENVRDSVTGRVVLIPQGARLIGKYDNVVAYGQERALVVWNRILLPDGSSIEIDNVPATDVSGYSGVADKVDGHTWRLLKGIVLSTLLGVGTELSLGNSEGDLVRAIRESAQRRAADAGDQITSRNLDIQPTITVRPGWPVRAILNKDLMLRPWTR
ncbi:MAG TPA: TrbI/VirB10 family protein [Sphingomicrobium sp.]|nr:TrbI/VirB10 family protein [Sphingomicrobium sp.]